LAGTSIEGEVLAVLKWSDSRNFSRTFAAFSLVVGPLLLLISVAVSPAFTVASEEPAEFLDAVARGRGAHPAMAVLFLAGSFILLPGVLGRCTCSAAEA
jgi:hypothetical protein